MSYIRILILLIFTSLIAPTFVFADGMIVPVPDRYIWETEQKAIIFYEDNKESLILSVTFQGDAENFAWIVPTPSRPQVNKSSDELFTSLEELTMPIVDYPRPLIMDNGLNSKAFNQQVHIIETKQIEYYEITVLEASDSSALGNWLNKNGYQYPKSGEYILDGYIKNNWYFTAVKINDKYLSQSIGTQLKTGHAVPLRLDFITDKMVYPLKISSIQADSPENVVENRDHERDEIIAEPRKIPSRPHYYPQKQIGVLIYVFSDSKQSLPKFNTQYAGWIKKDVIKDLAFDDNGEPWIEPKQNKYFLTKLYRSMRRSEMTSDLYLRQAKNNSVVNVPEEIQERGLKRFVVVMIIGGVLFLMLLGVLIVHGTRKE